MFYGTLFFLNNFIKKLYHRKPNSLLYDLHDVLLLIQKRNHKDATDIIHAIISEGFFFQN